MIARRRPHCDDATRHWLVKMAKRNLWRVPDWYDLSDLIEDGYLCWQIVVTKYPHVRNHRHLMALFQRTYINHIHQLSNRRTIQSVETVTDLVPEGVSDTDLRHLLAEAPAGACQKLLATILDHPELLQTSHSEGKRPRSTNHWLCSLIGVDPEQFNLAGQLRELLGATAD